jgi:putative ABC transport system permease protein
MVRYYIKLAILKFKSDWLVFSGSIITVSLGALCISLLFSYLHNELSMDGFHKRGKDIYMMVIRASPESGYEAFEPSLFFRFDYRKYPEIEKLVSLSKYNKGEINVLFGESVFSPEVLIADSTFFYLFDFKLLTGNKNTILTDPGTAIITEDFARKMFGDRDPIGQEIKVSAGNINSYTIKGVVERLPSNSSITFDLVLPNQLGSFERMGADFLLVDKNFNKESFIKEIENIGHSHPQFTESKIGIMSLHDTYFTKEIVNKGNYSIFSRSGDKKNIYILFVIILVILTITSLNFIGLQVIIINAGVRNIGLGKILGVKASELILQKLVEIMLIVCISALVVTIAYQIVLPYFNNFTKVMLSPSVGEIILLNTSIIFTLLVLAMIYPVIMTLRIPIIDSLKENIFSVGFRVVQKAVVTIQFALSIALIVASLVVFKQVSMMLNKDLGFDSENIIRVKIFKRLPSAASRDEWIKKEEEQQKSYQYVLNQLSSIPEITIFAQGQSPLNPYTMPWKLKGAEKDYNSQSILVVHPDYLKLLGLKISEGRFFDSRKDKSRADKIVINEAAKKYWGIEDIQKSLLLNRYWSDSMGYEIIGVVKDFNYEHLAVKPKPLFMVFFEDVDNDFLIKFKNGSVQSGLQSVARLFKEINPGEEFSYSFLSDEIAALYQKEKRLSRIYLIFTIVALLITAIGIFVIAIYDTQRRTKEIGIRKVNGARVIEIIALINRDFVKLVLVAYVISCPLAWFAMHKWLQNFAYRIALSWWVFAVAGAVAVVVAVFTVSWQSWKTATRNPVESLRYE